MNSGLTTDNLKMRLNKLENTVGQLVQVINVMRGDLEEVKKVNTEFEDNQLEQSQRQKKQPKQQQQQINN
jgi:hypothetical protein